MFEAAFSISPESWIRPLLEFLNSLSLSTFFMDDRNLDDMTAEVSVSQNLEVRMLNLNPGSFRDRYFLTTKGGRWISSNLDHTIGGSCAGLDDLSDSEEFDP